MQYEKEPINVNIEILKRLSEGMMYREISNEFKKMGISPNSLSIIDKRLKTMRKEWGCKTVMQLMFKVGKYKIV